MQLYELKHVLNRAMGVSIPQYGINTIVGELESNTVYPFIYLNRVVELKATGVMHVTITLK